MGQVLKEFFWKADVASTSYAYSRISDRRQGYGGVKTTGSSTTVVEYVTGTNPFAPLNVGDIVIFVSGEVEYKRKVVTKTSNAQIIVDSAVTLTACPSWYFQSVKSGTSATSGWQTVDGYKRVMVVIIGTTIAADGLDVQIEGRRPDETTAYVILTHATGAAGGYYSADGTTDYVALLEPHYAIRVGAKKPTSAAGIDDVTIYATCEPGSRIG